MKPRPRSWMSSPLDIFGGRTPEDLVSTGINWRRRRAAAFSNFSSALTTASSPDRNDNLPEAWRCTVGRRLPRCDAGRWAMEPDWHSDAVRAQHLSLACLEVLVHLDKSQLPRGYAWSKADLPQRPEILDIATLSEIGLCQRAGEVWIETANALLFRSLRHDRRRIQCAGEPQASRLRCLTWAEPRLFSFDPRLITAGPQTL
jgi:hypothetical protein